MGNGQKSICMCILLGTDFIHILGKGNLRRERIRIFMHDI